MKHVSSAMRLETLVSPAVLAKLGQYVTLLDRWRKITNLISERSFQEVWTRHVLDSVCLHLLLPDARKWIDIGSGAGFPGIVIGVLLAEREGAQVHCVESDARKCAFLREVVRVLDLPVKVHNARIEALPVHRIGKVDVVTARAFSSIQNILQVARPFTANGALVVLPRGKTSGASVEELDPNLYTVSVHANRAARDGVFVQIHERIGCNGSGSPA